MSKLSASIKKDVRLLLKDRIGLSLMFGMPIILVLLITTLQNNTFKIVNTHQLPLVLIDADKGAMSNEFIEAVDEIGVFELILHNGLDTSEDILDVMDQNDALVALIIPEGFSQEVMIKSEGIVQTMLSDMGFEVSDAGPSDINVSPLKMYYSPVLQESYRYAMEGALQSALQIVESKQMLKLVYKAMNDSELPEGTDRQLTENSIGLESIALSHNGDGMIPNASQHNVPAWTIFAMFFMVISLGSALVKEKLSGSFIRLKTMPGGYFAGLISKQLVYLVVAIIQVMVIFSLGIWVFPYLGLPALNIPEHLLALFVVSVVSGLCAISYALCIGVFAKTLEQASGFGAVSVVILAALGGILVPAFAMPDGFRVFTSISPLHWCLEAYYDLFLTGANLEQLSSSLIPLIIIIVILQSLAIFKLRRENLI